MNWKRILRDGSIVILLCVAFYFSANAIERISSADDRAFSQDRQLAEQYYNERNWKLASQHFAKLTDQDRFNGYAWFHHAICHLWHRSEIQETLEAQLEAGASESELSALRTEIREAEAEAIRCFEQSTEFLRHRRRSLVNLAVVYAGRQEWETALEKLTQYVDEGHMLTRSLEHISSLGVGGKAMLDQDPNQHPEARLHCFAEFWELVKREQEIRGLTDLPTPAPVERTRDQHRAP